jgi:threonine/homoserine/homoserine lactone efflux protein
MHTANELPWHKHFFSSALIALTNPSTYVSFGVIGLLLSRFVERPLFARIEVMVGFFIGALIWWCFLAYLAFNQRHRYYGTTGLQRAIGFIIILLAILTLFGPYNISAARFSFLTNIL